jgi:hypothetical protein
MLNEVITRNNLPLAEVWVQQPDRRLEPASPALTDVVLEDLATSRGRIIDAFGVKIPPIEARTEQTIASYFQNNHWSLPAYVTQTNCDTYCVAHGSDQRPMKKCLPV